MPFVCLLSTVKSLTNTNVFNKGTFILHVRPIYHQILSDVEQFISVSFRVNYLSSINWAGKGIANFAQRQPNPNDINWLIRWDYYIIMNYVNIINLF